MTSPETRADDRGRQSRESAPYVSDTRPAERRRHARPTMLYSDVTAQHKRRLSAEGLTLNQFLPAHEGKARDDRDGALRAETEAADSPMSRRHDARP